jgi:hypothetical protein
MQYTRRRVIAAIGLALAAGASAACASGGSSGGQSRPRQSDLIARDEITRAQWTTAYDMVLALRPRWLSTRGPNTIMGEQGEVQVRVDDSPAGGIAALRTIMPTDIASIRFVDPVAAAGRWGSSHMHGAILVTTINR